MNLVLSFDKNSFEEDEVLDLYKANKWSAAEKPQQLMKALRNSDTVVTARDGGKLVGIGNAISDGFLVVYYPHLLVHPASQGKGVGRAIMALMQQKYESFHQQILVADGEAVPFYKKSGFEEAGETRSMWIYRGDDH